MTSMGRLDWLDSLCGNGGVRTLVIILLGFPPLDWEFWKKPAALDAYAVGNGMLDYVLDETAAPFLLRSTGLLVNVIHSTCNAISVKVTHVLLHLLSRSTGL